MNLHTEELRKIAESFVKLVETTKIWLLAYGFFAVPYVYSLKKSIKKQSRVLQNCCLINLSGIKNEN